MDLEGLDNLDRGQYVKDKLSELGIGYEVQGFRDCETSDPGENIIVSSGKPFDIGVASHFDKVDGSPGANDNASAVAVTIDVLRKFNECSLENLGVRGFFFDKEEDGTKGSFAYVNEIGLGGLKGVYNMEMVGMGKNLALWCEGDLYEGSLLRSFMWESEIDGISVVKFPNLRQFLYNGGDHRRFNNAGMRDAFCITAVTDSDLAIANELFSGRYGMDEITSKIQQSPLFSCYHQPSDTSDNLNEDTMQMISRVLYKSINSLDASSQ